MPRGLAPGAAISSLLFLVSPACAQQAKEGEVITKGSVVRFEYTLSDDDGKVIESNKGKEPFTYTHGAGQIVPGLEKELAGLKSRDHKNVKVKPEEGYGAVNPQAFREVSKDKLPAEGLKVGTTLRAQAPQGQTLPVRVHEIKDKTVVLDLNHPLAGKTLNFDVTIVDVEPSEAK